MQALPFLALGSGIAKGVGGLMAGKANAKALREQAREERVAKAGEIRRVREDARRQIGEQYAQLAGNGMEGAASGGTALDLLRESQVEAALDVLELRRQGETRSRALEREAKLEKRRGKFALVEGILGGVGEMAGMKSDWAQQRRDEGR